MKPLLQIEKLTKYFRQTSALMGVTFHVFPGEIFGYLGPNGAGKTTTIRILLGLLQPNSGTAEVFGQDIRFAGADLRRRMGFVLQEVGLYDRLSAYDNMKFYGRLYGIPAGKLQQCIPELLEKVDLNERREEQVSAFSRGMKQRLAIARALLHKPELLFLDEPTAGMDPEGQNKIHNIIRRLIQGRERTVFLTSHNLGEVQKLCTRIAILRKGELLACDTIENLGCAIDLPRIKIRLTQISHRRELETALQQSPFVASFRLHDMDLEVELNDLEDTPKLLKFLIDKDSMVSEVRPVKQSLEEVYLNLVKENT